jgi:putative pyrimidine permease RutG
MTDRNLDKYLGRAFLGDAISTIVSASGGGTGVTTYAETISIYSHP